MEWFYAVGDDRRGPVSDAEFRVLVSNGSIRPGTLVWRQGMPDWSPYETLVGGFGAFAGEIEMRYAGFWIRFVAKFIDNIILGVVSLVIRGPILLGLAFTEDQTVATGLQLVDVLLNLFLLVVTAAYYMVFVGWKGATPGKMMLNLRVVRSDGRPVGYGLALGRWFASALNYLTFMIGWMMAGWTREKTGLHDIICDTRVIRVD